VKGTAGSTTETTTVTLTVTAAGSFTLTAKPSSLSLAPGGHGTSRITATASNGFDGVITLSASGQPSGVTIAFSPKTITGSGSATMSIKLSATAKAGTYTITVTGTSGSIVETTKVTLTIT